MKESFVFYRSFYEALEKVDDATFRQALSAICRFALYGEEPTDLGDVAKLAWVLVRPQLEANNKRAVNGKRGGAPIGNSNAAKSGQKQPKQPMVDFENNQKQPMVDFEKQPKQPNVNVNVNVNDIKKSEISLSFPDENDAQLTESISEQKRRFDPKPFIDHYNAECERLGSRLPRAKGKPAERRLEMLRARVAEYGEEAVMQTLTKAAASRFLDGGGPTGWKATGIDWVLRPNNFPKVYEGSYDNIERPNIGLGNSRQTGYEVGRILTDNSLTKYDGDLEKWKR